MPSEKKVEILDKTTELLKKGKAFYFTDFTGLTVQQMEKLRRELKKMQSQYFVIKNTIGLIAFKNLGYETNMMRDLFFGPIGIAIAYDDPLSPAKILQDTLGLKIKGALIEGTNFDAHAVRDIAKIPSKNVLYQSLVVSLNIVGNLVSTLQGILQNFVFTIEAIKNKNNN